MKLLTTILVSATFGFAAIQSCNGQSVSIGQGHGGSGVASIIGPGAATPVYSLVEESETTQTLADGTRIEGQISTRREYHDSQGRSRYEIYVYTTPQRSDPGTQAMLTINDPVVGFSYYLSPGDHIAHATSTNAVPEPTVTILQPRRSDPPTTASSNANATKSSAPKQPEPESVFEDLGTSTMNGIQVEGTRVTTTYPVGSSGNDRPFTVSMEQWVARAYGVNMLVKHNDPRSGVSVTRVTEFETSEPDASLFVVPDDYEVVAQR